MHKGTTDGRNNMYEEEGNNYCFGMAVTATAVGRHLSTFKVIHTHVEN